MSGRKIIDGLSEAVSGQVGRITQLTVTPSSGDVFLRMDAKHTPETAPWMAVGDKIYGVERGSVCCGEVGHYEPCCGKGDPTSRTIVVATVTRAADAPLVAALPDMLAALNEATEQLLLAGLETGVSRYTDVAMRLAALAKATGQPCGHGEGDVR